MSNKRQIHGVFAGHLLFWMITFSALFIAPFVVHDIEYINAHRQEQFWNALNGTEIPENKTVRQFVSDIKPLLQKADQTDTKALQIIEDLNLIESQFASEGNARTEVHSTLSS